MTDLLTEPLPTVWEGRAIDPDFRHMVRLLNGIRRAESDEERAQLYCEAIQHFFVEPVSPEALPEAFSSLVRFCQGGADEAQQKQTEASSGGSSEPLFDYHCDAAYFIGSFQQAYGIDLTVDRVHWWRFQALLRSLPCDTALGRILDFRGADTSEMDEAHRKYYEAMKERYALPPDLKGVKRVETLQEHEAAFIDRFG